MDPTSLFTYERHVDSRGLQGRTLLVTLGAFTDAGNAQAVIDDHLLNSLPSRVVGRLDDPLAEARPARQGHDRAGRSARGVRPRPGRRRRKRAARRGDVDEGRRLGLDGRVLAVGRLPVGASRACGDRPYRYANSGNCTEPCRNGSGKRLLL